MDAGVTQERMPSEVDEHVGPFDRFAGWASRTVSRAWFFAACVLLVVLWAPTLFFLDINTSQLLINTATTIITFLLVALLNNTQQRADQAEQRKLNAMADALKTVLAMLAGDEVPNRRLAEVRRELAAAVGLEERESS